jgi:hypothetical protein
MDDLELKLLKPVTFDGITHETLVLRELQVKELMALDKGAGNRTAFEQDVHLYALSAGVSPDLIKELHQRDWNRLRAKYWETVGNVVDDQEDPISA